MKVCKAQYVLLSELPGHEYAEEVLVFDCISCGDANHTLVWPEQLIKLIEGEIAADKGLRVTLINSWRARLLTALKEVPKHTYVSFGC